MFEEFAAFITEILREIGKYKMAKCKFISHPEGTKILGAEEGAKIGFVPERDEVTGNRRKLYNERLYNFCFIRSIFRMIN